ncbi:MAG: GNAT family N-acetyltransferase [candidate division NC10 bacterium]|nr:GNAT family N-acetyltransferase [candidate division NC10 bacterium]
MSPALQPAESFPTPATSAGDIVLRVLTAPDSLDGLLPGQGLGAYSRYRAGETLAILRRVLKAPEGRLVAALAGGTLVGYLALYQPSPEERWGQRPIPGLLELGALEVDRAWRRRGLARALLQATFAGGELDTAILIAPLYACDWDLETSGLQWREYRHLIHRLFRRHGFADFVTDDPLVTADPRNCLLVRVGEAAAPGLYQAFRALLSEVSPRVSAAEADRHQQYLGPGFTAIRQINQLPPEEQEAIYRRLIPRRVVELLTLDPATGRDPRGDRLVTYVCPPDQGFVRIEVRQHPPDQDCVFLLKLTQPAEELVEIAFIIANDPQAERFDVDRDPRGNPVGILSSIRNPGEEFKAMRAGLAPGQVRRGLRLFRQVLPLVEAFAGELGKEQISVEALSYHHAFLYERHGFGYLTGRDRLEEVHRGFQPGGLLRGRLDGSTPFRMPDASATVRGRSWAIHDGILGEPWRVPRLYKILGRATALPTFADCPY